MFQLEVPPKGEHRFSLAELATRRNGPSTVLTGWVGVAEPTILPLEKDLIGDDKVLLAEFRKLATKFKHFFVSFSCTFAPARNESFESAEISILLNEKTEEGPHPTVHSMRPNRLDDSVNITSKAGLGTDFKLASIELGDERSVARKDPFVLSFLDGQAACWRFARTEASRIEGSYPLQFIIRSPAPFYEVDGRIEVTAMTERRRFGLFWSRDDIDRPAKITFSCPHS